MAIITITIKPEAEGEPKAKFQYQVGASAAERVFSVAMQQLSKEDKRTVKTKQFIKSEK